MKVVCSLLAVFALDDYRVSGIVPSSAPTADIGVRGKNVHQLALSFVTPLRAKNDRDL